MKTPTKKSSRTEQRANIPIAVRAIVSAAMQAARAAAPRVEEIACQSARPRSASMMWKLARYAINGEIVVTVGTFTQHASLFFARGSELADRGGLLEGAGKKLRYITLRTPADARRPAVKALLRQAFALAESSQPTGTNERRPASSR